MKAPPVLAALRKHKAGIALIVFQTALTLAIVCNAVFIMGRHVRQVTRSSGLDEQNLFVIAQMYVNAPSGHGDAAIGKLDAMERSDLATVRSLPGVVSAAPISSLPLLNVVEIHHAIMLEPNQTSATASASFYYGGRDTLKTLGLRLVEGRDFTSNEVTHGALGDIDAPPVGIVSKSLAHTMFPRGDAVGKTVYIDGDAKPTRIIGVVARLQSPRSRASGGYAWNSILLPVRTDFFFTHTAVRVRPGSMAAAMREARHALFTANPERVMTNGGDGITGIYPFANVRARAYRTDMGVAILMGVICVILLCITAAGTVALTSFWVGQRRKQIGIRRALGATRHNILHYFQIENLLIAGGGTALGAILAVALNFWLMRKFQMDRMPLAYVWVGIISLLSLGQCAVLAPALRASRVPPVVAARSA